jgi:CRP/FNR family transcriptional regulator
MNSPGKEKAELFFKKYKTKSFKKDQVVLLAHDKPKYAYYITEGWVKQYDITQKGNEIVVNVFKPGSAFMVLTALTGLPSSYYFSAGSDVTVHYVPVKDATIFVSRNPEVLKDMLINAYVGYEDLLRRVTYLMKGGACGRVIFEILFDIRGQNGKILGNIRSLSITESDLALRAGLSRETVSREISNLKKKKLLSDTQKIKVLNVKKLEAELEALF